MVQRLKVEYVADLEIRIHVPASQVFQPERMDTRMISLNHEQAFALQADITRSLIDSGRCMMREVKTSVDD